jgi:hypothetical protein
MNRPAIRLAVAALAGVIVWLSAAYVSPWLGAAVAFVALAFLSSLIGDRAPTVVERIAGAEPINATIGADQGYYSDGWSLILDRDIDKESKLLNELEQLGERSILVESGAFDLAETHLLLCLEGRSVDTVRITGLRAVLLTRREPLSGAIVVSPSAGAQEIVKVQFDLDSRHPRALTEEGNDYFGDYVFTLSRGETIMFQIVGSVRQATCEWELIVDYVHRGSKNELRLDNAGTPFRTAARSKVVGAEYEWAWYEQPPRLLLRKQSGSPE